MIPTAELGSTGAAFTRPRSRHLGDRRAVAVRLGARSTTPSRSPRSAGPSTGGSTGSTGPRLPASGIPRRSSGGRWGDTPDGRRALRVHEVRPREAQPDGAPYGDLRPQSIRAECEEQVCGRLDVERLDLYQIHWPDRDGGTPLEESWSTMAAAGRRGQGPLDRGVELRRRPARALQNRFATSTRSSRSCRWCSAGRWAT